MNPELFDIDVFELTLYQTIGRTGGLENGADIQVRDRDGRTPLELARARESKEIFSMME